MARKNMFIRDDAAAPVAAPVPGLSAPKRPRTDAPAAGGAPLMPLPGGYGAPLQPQGYAPVTNVGDNPPCNTLFIGNLSDTVDEGELRGLFAHQPGFVQMKLVRGQRNTSAFVEFMDTETARLVHASQQGALLTTSGRGGIRIQFSKNPYGKKRDAGGQWVDSVPARPGGGGGDGVPAAGADGVQ